MVDTCLNLHLRTLVGCNPSVTVICLSEFERLILRWDNTSCCLAAVISMPSLLNGEMVCWILSHASWRHGLQSAPGPRCFSLLMGCRCIINKSRMCFELRQFLRKCGVHLSRDGVQLSRDRLQARFTIVREDGSLRGVATIPNFAV